MSNPKTRRQVRAETKNKKIFGKSRRAKRQSVIHMVEISTPMAYTK
jgi:hypothetical protein